MFAVTSRLLLRPGWPDDAAVLARAIGHDSVVRHLSRAPWPYTLGDAQAFLALPRGAAEPCFQIVERHGAYRLIGGIALMQEAPGAHELGYWLAPDAWGQGYASEAGRAVIAMARDTLRLKRIVARHHIDNPASGRVLRKLGFCETGHSQLHSLARGCDVACIDFALDLASTGEDDRPGDPDGDPALAIAA